MQSYTTKKMLSDKDNIFVGVRRPTGCDQFTTSTQGFLTTQDLYIQTPGFD